MIFSVSVSNRFVPSKLTLSVKIEFIPECSSMNTYQGFLQLELFNTIWSFRISGRFPNFQLFVPRTSYQQSIFGKFNAGNITKKHTLKFAYLSIICIKLSPQMSVLHFKKQTMFFIRPTHILWHLINHKLKQL